MMRALVLALSALILTACSLPTVNPEADAVARGFYDAVRTGADVSNDPRLAPDLRGPGATAEMARIRGVIVPEVAAQRIDNRSFNINTNTEGTRVELVHAYHYADRVVLAETVMHKAPGAPAFLIRGFHVRIEGTPPASAVNAAAQRAAGPAPAPVAAEPQAPAPSSNKP